MPNADDSRAIQADLTDYGMSAIRKASRRHARDIRELVIDVLDDQQLKQLGHASAVLLTALRTHEPRPE